MSSYTWWIYNSHKRFNVELPNLKKPSPVKRYVYMGDENKVAVEATEACRLRLDSDFFVLDLNETLYVSSF